nr:hypothetical protein [Tanacetum cinerariifolium]
MTSFGYRLNPSYAIKECSSCGTLYTRDCCCLKGNVEDNILVPKLSKNCARCGHPVNSPYCQGCTLLRQKLDEDLVTYFQNFQNTFESSDGSTNIVNAPREPFIVKQDHSVNPPHIDECCCECGEVLDGIFCQRCTCNSCGKGAHIGYNCPPKVPIISNPEPCTQTRNNKPPQTLPSFDPTCYSEKENSLPCVSKPNLVDESPNVFNPPPQPPMYSCELCESNAQSGHYYIPQVPSIYPKPSYSQDFNFSQNFHDFRQQKFNRYSFFETPKVLLLAWDRVSEIKVAFGNKQYKPEDIQELFRKLLDDLQNIHEELADQGWNRPAVYDDDDDDDVDYTIAITPILSTEEPDNSLSIGDEHLDTIPATESDKVIKSSVEDLVLIPSESEGVPDTMCDVHLVNNPTPLEAKDHFEIVINFNDDYSSSDDDYLYNENIEYVEASPHNSEVNLLIAKIAALKENPTPSSEFLIKSSSTSSKSLLEENKTFDNSFPEFENFYFDLEEISSGSGTTHSNISLPNYEAFSFYDDHIEEISSGSTTTHSDISLSEYDSFIIDLSKDQFPPTDRSDFTHEEFADELAHIISPPKYGCFYFGNLPDPGEWISSLNSGICENLSFTTCVNLPVEDDHSLLLAYVVWIFLAYLTYLVIPPHLYLFGNKDTIFDPGITINRFYLFKPGLSHRSGSESRPPMLNKENYVPWSSRLLRYAKSRPNGKLIHNSILNGPYVRKMIPEPGDINCDVNVTETFHLQTDDELSDKELKQIEADDQAIQTILLGLPEDIYATVDSCETAQEIWLRVQQMMKGSDIGIQEKKAKLFNEWKRFTSNEGKSIESYYHRFLKLMNDLKRNKHFPENIASNLKFLNNLQPEWSRHVTIVHQTKDLHTADYTQLYDFLKYNQKERISSNPRNRQIAQPGMNMGQDRQMQIVVGNGKNQFRQYVGQNARNLAGYNDVIRNQAIQNVVQNPRVQNVGN